MFTSYSPCKVCKDLNPFNRLNLKPQLTVKEWLVTHILKRLMVTEKLVFTEEPLYFFRKYLYTLISISYD